MQENHEKNLSYLMAHYRGGMWENECFSLTITAPLIQSHGKDFQLSFTMKTVFDCHR